MLCADIAAKVLEPAEPDQTAQSVAERFRDGHISWLPVCEPDNGKVVGIITERDLATEICAQDRLSSQTPVSAIMTRDVVTCSAQSDFQVAEELMLRHRTGRVVIVDEQQRFYGVLSLTDVLHYSDPLRAASVARTVKDSQFRVRASKGPLPGH